MLHSCVEAMVDSDEFHLQLETSASPHIPRRSITGHPIMEYNSAVDKFRDEEYPMMAQGTYLDHGGATIYARSLIDSFSHSMINNLWGNPHSENLPARLSGDMVDSVRAKALGFLGADPEHFDLVFVQNATAAIKLVADAFRDLGEKTSSKTFWYGYHREVHTSLVGVREFSGGDYHCFDDDRHVDRWLDCPLNSSVRRGKSTGLGLFAYPGQSNLGGRRLPKGWLKRIRKDDNLRNTYTLFDAAALAMNSSMASLFNDPEAAPDFTCLSFYKIFGFPDLGALVVRRKSGHVLNLRKYFGGGTIAQLFPLNGDGRIMKKASGLGNQYVMWNIHDGLEDGTLPFHNILALGLAIDTHISLYGSMDVIARHTNYLSHSLYKSLVALRYTNGHAVVEVYVDDPAGCGDPSRQGATYAFNVVRKDGTYVPWTEVEKAANQAGVFIRAGGVCCPGGTSKALGYEEWEWNRLFSSGHVCGANDLPIIHNRPTGIVRASLGPMSTKSDVQALILFLHNEFVAAVDGPESVGMVGLLETSMETLRMPFRGVNGHHGMSRISSA